MYYELTVLCDGVALVRTISEIPPWNTELVFTRMQDLLDHLRQYVEL
ncbi:hypothetical protein [Chitinivibrio alkaliphilus]|nr:hypothetical protein [Chitinivibrio alkaliphilus]